MLLDSFFQSTRSGRGLWDLVHDSNDISASSRGLNHPASIPPSTARDAPTMYEALSEPMNTMALAISSGVPMRLVGMCVSRKFALFCCVCAKWLNIRVSVGPGPTMLTRTPVPASSMAADFVIPSTACLLPTYIAAVGPPTLPYEDEMLTMLPLPFGSMARISYFMHRSTPSTFVSKMA